MTQGERQRERKGPGRSLHAIHDHISASFLPSLPQTFTTSPHSYIHTLLLHSHIIIIHSLSCSAIPWNREKTDDTITGQVTIYVCTILCLLPQTMGPKNAVLYAAYDDSSGRYVWPKN